VSAGFTNGDGDGCSSRATAGGCRLGALVSGEGRNGGCSAGRGAGKAWASRDGTLGAGLGAGFGASNAVTGGAGALACGGGTACSSDGGSGASACRVCFAVEGAWLGLSAVTAAGGGKPIRTGGDGLRFCGAGGGGLGCSKVTSIALSGSGSRGR